MSLPESFDEDPPEPSARPRKPAAAAREEDPRPFVERYRGTQWDYAPPPGPLPAPRRRFVIGWPILIGAVLAIVALVVSATLMFLGSRKPTALSAFRDATPAPAQVWVRPAPTATVAGPTAVPTPSPPPAWMADSRHPAALFIAGLSQPDLSFHLKAAVAIYAQGTSAAIDYAMDVSGPDYSVRLSTTSTAGTVSVDMVVKDGYFYARTDDSPWVRGEGAPPPGNPFGALTADSYANLEYVGRESVAGRMLHHVRLPVYHWPGPTDRALAIVGAPAVLTWDIWVDDGGRPRAARMTVDVTVRVQGRDVPTTLDFDYSLSKFGKVITIDLPAPFRG